ncbi:hypothetical protein P22_3466 [Propionispora sp. 2/2-37]|uniref:magnesium transporter n=1 Tax=Propionispora sp. 2/2-37 TaxID=1677858 RepID=UPI0006BB6A0B|nr:CBS domain-containing protein [Propionispora sp. 2/2-37]CUH97339.1 hypothetical protein P22_3466 [Propionispora sp. 2/2-37]
MHSVKLLGKFYFSQMLGKSIYDAAQKRIGRVKDMAVSWNYSHPRVSGIKYARKIHELIPFELVERCDENGLYLNCDYTENCTVSLQDEEFYISKWLLDKQIIDLKGVKIVRVNDITLSWLMYDGRVMMVLTAVDIGIRGLFRRLGLEFLFKRFENRWLGWQYIKPLESWNSALQLKMEKQQLGQLHPADIADLLAEMDYKRRAAFIDHLDVQQTVKALSEMPLATQVKIIGQMDDIRAIAILRGLPSDEIADILGGLSFGKSEQLLSLMRFADAEAVRKLMQYKSGTAGALMTREYIGLSGEITASGALARLKEIGSSAETIYYLYVLNEYGRLEGVLSLRKLLTANDDASLYELMERRVIAAQDTDSDHLVAKMMTKYGLLAVPVIDTSGTMLGIVTVDDILSLVLSERGKADAYSLFAVSSRIGRGRYT